MSLLSRFCALPMASLAMLAALADAAHADKRVALVVGNSAYANITPLDNPRNDARLMADTLRSLGFSLVGNGPQLDLDKARFDSAVQSFGTLLQGADVGLFYYAGHGVQVRGANYLVPVGANPTREADVDFQMLDTNLVLRQMESAGTKLNLVILDACRNNPFGGRGLRATAGGLAQMRAPEGTLISFATQPGNVAADGADGNSPYTRALVQTIRRPGLGIFDAFNEVGLAVMSATGGAQQPWVSTSPIKGNFYFAGLPAGGLPVPAGPAADEVAWGFLKNTTDVSALRQFLAEFRTSPRRAEAEARIAALERPSRPPTSAPPSRDDIAGRIDSMIGIPPSPLPPPSSMPPSLSDRPSRPPADDVSKRIDSMIVLPPMPPPPDTGARRSFRVLENVSQGVLNIRTGPGTANPLVVAVPAGASDLSIGRCVSASDGSTSPWCEVQWRGYKGWISSCCIAEVAAGVGGERRTFRVLPDVSQGILNVRDGPGTRYKLVVSIPAGATDVLVGHCRMPDDGGRTAWCETEWRGKKGWASACCMVDVKTGAYARSGN